MTLQQLPRYPERNNALALLSRPKCLGYVQRGLLEPSRKQPLTLTQPETSVRAMGQRVQGHWGEHTAISVLAVDSSDSWNALLRVARRFPSICFGWGQAVTTRIDHPRSGIPVTLDRVHPRADRRSLSLENCPGDRDASSQRSEQGIDAILKR